MKRSRVAVIGCGYVGLAYVALLSKRNDVVAYDVDQSKLDAYRGGQFNFTEKNLVKALLKNRKQIEYKDFQQNVWLGGIDVIFVCVPTNYDESQHRLDVSILNDVILKITQQNPTALIVIKSTIPFGYTDEIIERANNANIVFVPEFLREGQSFYDLQHPSRVILGCDKKLKDMVTWRLKEIGLLHKKHPFLHMGTKEAESVKLFANSYLAMRVAFFNELDNFALKKQLNCKDLVQGVCADGRIGNFYNNPSFGFGGYCLEKDTKQCAGLFTDNVLLRQIVESNNQRKQLILEQILVKLQGQKNPTVGIYNLGFKQNSDNYRNSPMLNLIQGLQAKQINVVVFDENLADKQICGCPVIQDFDAFVKKSNLIVANRCDQRLKNLPNLFSRDLFGEN